MSTNDGGPAFPRNGGIFIEGPQGRDTQSAWGMDGAKGMTLRDYFAAHAPQDAIDSLIGTSILSASNFLGLTYEAYSSALHYVPAVAKARYMYADAMIAERSKIARQALDEGGTV